MHNPSEDALLERLLAAWRSGGAGFVDDACGELSQIGPGDDCALLSAPAKGWSLVAKLDAVVEGRHFLSSDGPALVGHKALARAVSDFASMGATPEVVLISVGFPFDRRDSRWLLDCYRGMARSATRWGIALGGGELTRMNEISLSVSLHGRVRTRAAVLRSGGQPGDVLLVTGKLGGSFPKRHLRFEPRLAEGQWLAQAGVRAMMDLSDGLARDLPRLARASGCSFALDPSALPRNRGASASAAVNDGEDYELLCAVSPRRAVRLLERWPFDIPLTPVGKLLASDASCDTGGLTFGGWDHVARATIRQGPD